LYILYVCTYVNTYVQYLVVWFQFLTATNLRLDMIEQQLALCLLGLVDSGLIQVSTVPVLYY